MATRKTTTSDSFKKSDGFINLTVVIKFKDGSERSLKAPVWGLDAENPLHKLMLANPEKAAEAIEIRQISIHQATSEKDLKGLEF
jgi:hypothetical protein